MKFNIFMVIISLAIVGLIAFGFYSANGNEEYRILLTIGAGISLFVTLGVLLAVSSPNRGTLNLKIVSALFFVMLLVEHILFGIFGVSLTPYIIITGIVLLIYVIICYAIIKTLK